MRIKDVAHLAGVSTATVSHVINNTRFVREETRRKVLDAIERCDYSPNLHARSLASGRTTTLGLIISDIANPFFPELVKNIQEAATEEGYDLILANTNYDPARTLSCVQHMLERRVRGVAIMTSEMDFSLIDQLAAKKVSVVFLDLGPVGPHMSNIAVDYEDGIGAGVEYLIGLGHRRIAYIGGPSRLRSAARRRSGFEEVMEKYAPTLGTTPLLFEGDLTAVGGRRATAQILGLGERPTAIVAANDLTAIGVLRELHRAGVGIPEEMSVIGFDDISFAALTEPPLTTIVFPRAEIGRAAVEALMHTIRAEGNLGREYTVSTQLKVRESTGPVPAGVAALSFGTDMGDGNG